MKTWNPKVVDMHDVGLFLIQDSLYPDTVIVLPNAFVPRPLAWRERVERRVNPCPAQCGDEPLARRPLKGGAPGPVRLYAQKDAAPPHARRHGPYAGLRQALGLPDPPRRKVKDT